MLCLATYFGLHAGEEQISAAEVAWKAAEAKTKEALQRYTGAQSGTKSAAEWRQFWIEKGRQPMEAAYFVCDGSARLLIHACTTSIQLCVLSP